MRTAAIVLTAVLSAASVPAFAAWDKVASMNFAVGGIQSRSGEFNGNVMGLTARDSDVMCDRVVARFADGGTRPIFRGELPKGVSVRVDLPPRPVQRVDFKCHSVDQGRATVDIAADTAGMMKTSEHKG